MMHHILTISTEQKVQHLHFIINEVMYKNFLKNVAKFMCSRILYKMWQLSQNAELLLDEVILYYITT